MKKKYFDNIHLLRAFAALSVVVYHLIELVPWKDPLFSVFPMLWFRVGWMGVDLFFVISGFVISFSALRLLRDNSRSFPRTYLQHRFARIMPLYYVTGLAYIVIFGRGLIHEPDFLKQIMTHVFFLHNLFPTTHGSINGINWTLGVEMQFYLLILLTARWIARLSPWAVLAITLLVSWGYRALVFGLLAGSGKDTWGMFFYATQLFGMLDEFGFGIFLSRIVLGRMDRSEDTMPGTMKDRLLDNGWVWLLGAGGVFIVVWRIFWANASYWDNRWMVVFWRSGLALAFFFLVGAAVFIRIPSRAWQQGLRPFLYMGETSYGIYLWHVMVILGLQASGIVVNGPPFAALTILITLMLSSMSWHLLEKPMVMRYR